MTPRWRAPLTALACTIAAILWLFHADAVAMVTLWWTASTYQHCLFILPIVAWLIVQRRAGVALVEPAGWPPALALVLAAALIWLVGQASGIALLRQAGLVLMVQASVIVVLGPAVARAIAFPLFYLIFLVPFGDEIVGPMQTLTARMTMTLLGLTGIAAHLDGVFITTNAGWFEVAEACAGVKFLVAMLAYGALVANVCFKSTARRAIFMVVAVVLPILANGVRAWATIFAASLTSADAASGFDHIVYGWIFFGLVMALLVGGASPFFDSPARTSWVGRVPLVAWAPRAAVVAVAPLAVAVAALPVVWDAVVSPLGRVTLINSLAPPVVPGWTPAAEATATPWLPHFDGADRRIMVHYVNAAGHRVDLALVLYGWQGPGREIAGAGQGAATAEGPWRWAADLPPVRGGMAQRLLGPRAAAREAVTFRQVGGHAVTSRAAAKLAALTARLTGADQSAAALIVSAEGPGAAPVLDDFLTALGDPHQTLITALGTAKGTR